MVRLRPLPVADEGSNKNCVAVKILSRRIERAQKFWVTARRRLEPTLREQQVPETCASAYSATPADIKL